MAMLLRSLYTVDQLAAVQVKKKSRNPAVLPSGLRKARGDTSVGVRQESDCIWMVG
jgi:hypothetical protein